MDRRHQELLKLGDEMFSKRQEVLSLWQELADNFYPERGDFLRVRTVGTNYAADLDTSYPIIARRDLGDAFGAMLRPPGKHWFSVWPKREDNIDEAGRKWLEMATRVQRRAIYDGDSNFIRATKQGDHDFATFGQCVLTSEMAFHPVRGPVLLHRSFHLKDVAWCDDAFGKVGHVQRKWDATVQELVETFGKKKLHPSVVAAQEKEPYRIVPIRHVKVPASGYDGKLRTPYVSIYIDTENQHVIEETGLWVPHYVIPRWKTEPGSPYAYSPAALAALPDAKLLQAMTYTLLTAGEFAVNPPMVGYPEAIKGSAEIFPGGFTALDMTYDERLGEALRPLMKGGDRAIPLGLKMNQDTRMMIADAWYLTKLNLPQAGLGGMSPLEVRLRTEEFIRATLPLFEPMESEYNGGYMEQDFDLLLRAGAFGPPEAIPDSLKGQETEFRFESPLRESIERIKVQQFLEAKALTVEAAQVEPMTARKIDWMTAYTDALHGGGTPAAWLREDEDVIAEAQAMQQKAATMTAINEIGAGAALTEQVGKSAQAVRQALEPSQQPAEQAA